MRSAIVFYDRRTGTLEEETVYERWFMRLFYGTEAGRVAADLFLKRRAFSTAYGALQKTSRSRRKIPGFMQRFGIHADELEKPPSAYGSFNEFFTRRLQPWARPVDPDPAAFVSPADGRLWVGRIEGDTVLPVKGRRVALADMARDRALVRPYVGGLCMVLRLAFCDYHRFCYLDAGTHGPIARIPGTYASVTAGHLWPRRPPPVLRENYREVCQLRTERFGDVVEIDVGGMVVGRIVQHFPLGRAFARGEEKGYFEFGASTIVLLVKPGVVEVDADILDHAARGVETLVRYGSRIGRGR